MKYLARWTIGNVTSLGFKILKESVKKFQKIYPEFDCVVCYNHCGDKEKQILDLLRVPLYKQSHKDTFYPLTDSVNTGIWNAGMSGSGWKLCPPRISIASHELWIDNDLIINSRIPLLDNWLESNHCIISEGLYGGYGIFKSLINSKIKACAGLFGVPPFFNTEKALLNLCQFLQGSKLGGFDEQGIVVKMITDTNYTLLPLTQVFIADKDHELNHLYPAIHFVGANRLHSHVSWNNYKKLSLLI